LNVLNLKQRKNYSGEFDPKKNQLDQNDLYSLWLKEEKKPRKKTEEEQQEDEERGEDQEIYGEEKNFDEVKGEWNPRWGYNYLNSQRKPILGLRYLAKQLEKEPKSGLFIMPNYPVRPLYYCAGFSFDTTVVVGHHQTGPSHTMTGVFSHRSLFGHGTPDQLLAYFCKQPDTSAYTGIIIDGLDELESKIQQIEQILLFLSPHIPILVFCESISPCVQYFIQKYFPQNSLSVRFHNIIYDDDAEKELLDFCDRVHRRPRWADPETLNRCEFKPDRKQWWEERIAAQTNMLINPRFVTFHEWKQSFHLQPTQIRRSIKCWLLCLNRLEAKLPPDILDSINFWIIYLWFW